MTSQERKNNSSAPQNALRLFCVLFCVSFAVLPIAGATDYSSSNYIVRDPIFGTFGGNSTSTNFDHILSGGQTADGRATSTSFIMRGGFLYFDGFTPVSQNWRWYDDEDNETPTSALANENTAPSSVLDQNEIKLRITIQELAGVSGALRKYKLQYGTSSDFSTGATDIIATSSCVSSSIWCYGDGSADSDNDIIQSKILSDADSCSGGSGDGCGMHNETPTSTTEFSHPMDGATEYEFTIKSSGAEYNQTYFFRPYEINATSAVALGDQESYPSLSTAGVTLTLTVSGLPIGTSTEGITTDATSTATTVPFGTLSVGSETEAAQRISVSTSANEGYQLYAFQRQGLIRSGGSAITPVTGTNASPSAWGTGCDASAKGCYGYHAGDDALSDSSARFSANDTYAQFDGTAREAAFSSIPVSSETTDIIYKIEVTNLQESGDYESSVVYIVVPTF
ncbi:hypothetical protein CL629_00715 [bacterium]|nr:hypothetical protein [bacterium]|tara:strand:- start:4032 stop:5390 length:1359 start_codon:yes stop_codon:yes gene_type:complete